LQGRVDGGVDAYGKTWTLGVVGDRVGLSVDPNCVMLRFNAEQREQFARAWAEAERRAEAVARAVTPGQVTP
jgi:hypothetical protein